MGDYQEGVAVDAPNDALFDYLADVRNLHRYFSAMTSAEPADGEAVRATATVNGTTRESEAWFRVDHDHQHLEWGSDSSSEYHGSLDVSSDAAGSAVTVNLHTDRVEPDQVQQGIVDTRANVKRLVEAGPAPGPGGSDGA